MPWLIHVIFQPLIDACSPFSHITFDARWRLFFMLQPIAILTFVLSGLCYHLPFGGSFETIQVPLSSKQGKIRCIVIRPTGDAKQSPQAARKLKPLHIAVHGGAFIGGLPDNTIEFASKLCQRVDCVTVGISYRFAPRYPFPTAHDDVRDVVTWICANAERLWGADGSKVTVSGSSAGANLAFDLAPPQGTMREVDRLPHILAWIGFYAPINLRLKPGEKPMPSRYPKRDPTAFLLPLYDAYGASGRSTTAPTSLRLNPCLRTTFDDLPTLPRNLLFIAAGIDILRKEQIDYLAAVKRTMDEPRSSSGEDMEGQFPIVDLELYEDGFHGWLELPYWILPKWAKSSKRAAFERAFVFLENVIKKDSEESGG